MDQATNSAPAKAGATKDEDSVTNTQHAGVDEGGIVKLHGDHLVVLRRGRLFTVAVGDNALKPISAVDAFGPEIDPRSTWYDEMLVSDDTVVVIGYSYERGGTEVGLFNIDASGQSDVSIDLSSAFERLLFVAQLCEPLNRQQVDLLHAAVHESVRGRSNRHVSGRAQVAQGRDAAGISAHRFRDARLSSGT